MSGRSLEALEAQRQAVAVRAVPDPIWQMQCAVLEPFQGIQHRTVVLREKTFGNMHATIRVDADQVGVERGIVDLG